MFDRWRQHATVRVPVQAVTATYAPDLDGAPDPGEVVWAWIPYEDDPSQGKDRPVVVIGLEEADLVVVPLTTKPHPDVTMRFRSASVAGTRARGSATRRSMTSCGSRWSKSGAKARCSTASASTRSSPASPTTVPATPAADHHHGLSFRDSDARFSDTRNRTAE